VRLVGPVLDILTVNSRQPELLRGDLWAQIAADRRAAMHIVAKVNRHGHPAYDAALDDAFARGRARALAGLRALSPSRAKTPARRTPPASPRRGTLQPRP